MNDIVNERIKSRKAIRRFAPSILEERLTEYFDQSYSEPFMVKVYSVRPEKRPIIPTATYVDDTGHLQPVDRRTNPRCWGLIKAFERITRGSGCSQHIIQRERADRQQAGRSDRLLRPDADGLSGSWKFRATLDGRGGKWLVCRERRWRRRRGGTD